jgi:hypothetical protein
VQRFAAGLGFGAFLCATVVGAAPTSGVGPIALDYLAPAGCPARDEFIRRVEARGPIELDATHPRGRKIRAQIERQGAMFSARLVMATDASHETTRELTADSCAEMVDALALTAAMAIAGWAPESPVEVQIETPDAASSSRDRAFETAPVARDVGSTFHFVAIGAPYAAFGYFPEAMPAADISLGVARAASSIDGVATLGFRALRSGERALPEGVAQFRWDMGHLRTCPIGFAWARSWSLLPCLYGDLGQLTAESRLGAAQRTQSALWASVGAGGSLIFRPLSALLLTLDANVVFPLTRPTFGYGPEINVVRPGRVAGEIGVGAGLYL